MMEPGAREAPELFPAAKGDSPDSGRGSASPNDEAPGKPGDDKSGSGTATPADAVAGPSSSEAGLDSSRGSPVWDLDTSTSNLGTPTRRRGSTDSLPGRQGSGDKKGGFAAKALRKVFSKKGKQFRSLFPDIPATELLLADYSCAIQREILVHGRLYITRNFVCFHSNIFGWETLVVIRIRDIVGLSKEKTALVIPNAIQIVTQEKKFLFASFMYRDQSYRCLFTVWQSALLGDTMSVSDLAATASRSWRGSMPSLSNMRSAGTEEMPAPGDRFADTHSVDSRVSGSSRSSSSKLSEDGQDSPPQGEESAREPHPLSASQDARPADSSASSSLEDEGYPVQVPDHDEIKGNVLLDQEFPCSVEYFMETFFTDNQFFHDLYQQQKTTNFTCTSWSLPHDGHGDGAGTGDVGKVRSCSYTLKLNYTFGPKRTIATDDQLILHADPGRAYIVESKVTTPAVPYGDNFQALTRYYITAESPRCTHATIRSMVIYRKGPPWALTRNLIEKNSYKGMAQHWTQASKLFSVFCAKDKPSRVFQAATSDAKGRRHSSAVEVGTNPPFQRGHTRQSSAISYHSVAFEEETSDDFERTTAYCEALSKQIRVGGLVAVILGLVLWNLYLVGRLAAAESAMGDTSTASCDSLPQFPSVSMPDLPVGDVDVEAIGQHREVLGSRARAAIHALASLTEALGALATLANGTAPS